MILENGIIYMPCCTWANCLLHLPNTMDLSLCGAACVYVWGRREEGGKLYASMLAVCVYAWDTACAVNWRGDVWYLFMKYLNLTLFPHLIPIHYCTVSPLDPSGKHLGMRVFVLFSLVQTIHKEWLLSFVSTSCVVNQHRSFFQHQFPEIA